MPTKKAASKGSSNAVWMWVYVIGVVVAGLIGAFPMAALQPWLGYLLLLAGILSGIFFLDSDDVVNFGIRYLLLAAVAGALSAVPAVGSFVTGFFGGVVGFLGPVGLTLLVVYFWKKYFSGLM